MGRPGDRRGPGPAESAVAGPSGEYRLQALIAAEHARAPRAEDTDWPRIVFLHDQLEQMVATDVVRVNRAVAVAMVRGPRAGLAALEGVSEAWAATHRVLAVRAHLLETAGDRAGAIEHYALAAARATNTTEQRYLIHRARTACESDP